MTDIDKKSKRKEKLVNIMLVCLKLFGKIGSVSTKLIKIALLGTSFAVYSYMFSWQFSIIILVQLLIHEYGHIWAMKRVGLETKGIYFIPFVGGAAVASEDFKSRYDEVYVAIMGPIFGFACAFFMMIIYWFNEEPMYAAAASWMAMVNIFNLLPLNPLDGGRIMKSIAFSIRSWLGYAFMAVGILLSIFLAFYAHIWIFIMVIVLSSIEFYMEFYYEKKREKRKIKFKATLDEVVENYIKESVKENIIPDLGFILRMKEKNEQAILEHYPETVIKPIMSKKQIAMTVIAYFILAFSLFFFMQATNDIPGAKLAMEFLQD